MSSWINRATSARARAFLLVLTAGLTMGTLGACGSASPSGQTAEPTAEPTAITSKVELPIQIATGGGISCAVLSGGKVKCWGDNSFGQLGNKSAGADSSTPVKVEGVTGATSVSAGRFHTCALILGGTVKCWGSIHMAEFGRQAHSFSYTPVAVSGMSGAIAVTAGSYHACALVSGGAVMCWGDNSFGQLGDGTTTPSSTPVQVIGLSGATAVSATGDFTCALLSDGTAQCWGDNTYGELGSAVAGKHSAVPVSVAGVSGAIAVSAGGAQACALLSDSTVECWGDNHFSQLGAGDTTLSSSATPVAVEGLTGATDLSAGGAHSCAILVGGTVKCWGINAAGELGDGTSKYDSPTPVSVSGLSGATAVATGGVSCAILSGGKVKCWGYNLHGALGDGTMTSSSTPVSVRGL